MVLTYKDAVRNIYISNDNVINMLDTNKLNASGFRAMKFNIQNIVSRSPRLDTVAMVENFIKENSGELGKTELFNKLPKKVMWGTFNVILQYLYDNNKIGVDSQGKVVYIWNPELAKKFINAR